MVKKLPLLEISVLNLHKNKIIKDLKFKHEPIVIYGVEALAFLRENVPAYHNKSDKKIYRNTGGYFHYENVSHDYIKTGVVCVLNGKIGTLAHELRHAKQYQDNSKWMNFNKWKRFYYKIGYFLYPAEIQAFWYATVYLFKSKLYKLGSLYSFTLLRAMCFTPIIMSIISGAIIILFIKFLL